MGLPGLPVLALGGEWSTTDGQSEAVPFAPKLLDSVNGQMNPLIITEENQRAVPLVPAV